MANKIAGVAAVKKLIDLVRAARVLRPGEVTGDKIADETITPDKLIGMIQGGGSSTGELEDLAIQTGSVTNAGSGWNTLTFPWPFEDVPQVVASAEGEYSVQVQGVTATKFLYRVVKDAAASLSLTKAAYWVHTAQATSTGNMQSVQLVTGGSVSGGGAATADAVRVMWAAFEFGGDK